MNRAAALVVISLIACGGSSEPLFGGFTPANGAAVILAPATCSSIALLGPTPVSGVLIELASGADACNVLTQAKQCGAGANSTTILAGAFSGIVGGSTVAAAGSGTYPFLANPPTGAFKAAITSAAKVDATCTSAGSPPQMSGGSILISSVSASTVSGSLDVQFDNGQAYKAPFDVAVCPVSIDICSLFSFCGTHTCVQP